MTNPDWTLTLKPCVIFPKNVGGVELTQAPGPDTINVCVSAGTQFVLAELRLNTKAPAQPDLPVMILNHVTRKFSGAMMRPGFAPAGGMITSDDVPLSSSMIFSDLQRAYPDLSIGIVSGWQP